MYPDPMTMTQYAAKYMTDLGGLSRAWGISRQTLKQYSLYLQGRRGKRTGSRCPTHARQLEIERLTNGEVTPADWPAYDDPTTRREE